MPLVPVAGMGGQGMMPLPRQKRLSSAARAWRNALRHCEVSSAFMHRASVRLAVHRPWKLKLRRVQPAAGSGLATAQQALQTLAGQRA